MMAAATTLCVRPRWITHGLGAILTVVSVCGRLQIAAAEASETKDIIASNSQPGLSLQSSKDGGAGCRCLQAR